MTEQTEIKMEILAVQRYRKVSDERLRRLLQAEAELKALKNGGVDNWEWYSESRHDSPDWDDEECDFDVEDKLANYELVEEQIYEAK